MASREGMAAFLGSAVGAAATQLSSRSSRLRLSAALRPDPSCGIACPNLRTDGPSAEPASDSGSEFLGRRLRWTLRRDVRFGAVARPRRCFECEVVTLGLATTMVSGDAHEQRFLADIRRHVEAGAPDLGQKVAEKIVQAKARETDKARAGHWWCVAVKALAEAKRMDAADHLWAIVQSESKGAIDGALYFHFLNGYALSGQIDKVRQVIELMRTHGVRPKAVPVGRLIQQMVVDGQGRHVWDLAEAIREADTVAGAWAKVEAGFATNQTRRAEREFESMLAEGLALEGPMFSRMFKYYMKSRQIDKAAAVFESERQSGSVPLDFMWDWLVGNLVIKGQVEQALNIFRQGRRHRRIFSAKTLGSLMKTCVDSSRFAEAVEIGGYGEELGAVDYISFWLEFRALMELGLTAEACLVVDKMRSRGLEPNPGMHLRHIEWLVDDKQGSVAVDAFLKALSRDVRPPPKAFGYLLKAHVVGYDVSIDQLKDCLAAIDARSRDRPGEETKDYLKKAVASVCSELMKDPLKTDVVEAILRLMEPLGLTVDHLVFGLTVDNLIRSGNIEGAESIVGLMPSFGIESHGPILTMLVGGYAKAGQLDKMEGLVERLKGIWEQDDRGTLFAIMHAYRDCGEWRRVKGFAEWMLEKGVAAKMVCSMYNQIIDACEKRGDGVQVMESILAQMAEVRAPINGFVCTTVVKVYCKFSKFKQAVDFIQETEGSGVEPSTSCYNALLKGYLSKGMLVEGERLVAEMEAKGVERDIVTFNILLNGYTTNGRILDAERMFSKMATKDVVSYNVMLKAYMEAKLVDRAEALFRSMKEVGVGHDIVSFNTLLNGYFECLAVAKAENLLLQLEAAGVQVDLGTYYTVRKGYTKVRQSHKFYAWEKRMRARSLLTLPVTHPHHSDDHHPSS